MFIGRFLLLLTRKCEYYEYFKYRVMFSKHPVFARRNFRSPSERQKYRFTVADEGSSLPREKIPLPREFLRFLPTSSSVAEQRSKSRGRFHLVFPRDSAVCRAARTRRGKEDSVEAASAQAPARRKRKKEKRKREEWPEGQKGSGCQAKCTCIMYNVRGAIGEKEGE